MRARPSPASTNTRGGRSRIAASPRSTPRLHWAHWPTRGSSLSDVDAYLCDSTAGFGRDLDGRVPRPPPPLRRLDRDGWLLVPGPRRPCGRPPSPPGGATSPWSPWPVWRAAAARRQPPGPRDPRRRASSPRGACRPSTGYALAAQRHMFEFGTTSAQLAEVKVAASLHAQHNPHALLPNSGDGRGGARLPRHQLAAPPPRLLRRHRRWWRSRGGEPRGGPRPGAPDRARSWARPKR